MNTTNPFDVIVVADGRRTSLTVALCLVIAKKTCPAARFHVARIEGADMEDRLAERVIAQHAERIFYIPPPSLLVAGNIYRIANKISAMSCSGLKRAVLIDSDILFLRSLPVDFIFRDVPTVVPEHGYHEFPWLRLFALANLIPPRIKVLLGDGLVTEPWFNAGFICAPDATQFGYVWRMMCDLLLNCDWVPELWPYLDQIALPLTLAQLSEQRTVTNDNVLPAIFNQNLFLWREDQSYVREGYVAHHHTKLRLIERYFEDLIMWTRGDFPVVDEVVAALRPFDKD
jgi:hypothetical protein